MILAEVEIPDYPDKVMIAKERRPVYYVSRTSKTKGKSIIPKSYLKSPNYFFNDKGILIDRKTGQPKLANPRTAGQERYWTVNFQQIWNGAISAQSRAGKVNKLKDLLYPYIKSMPVINEYPVRLELFLFDKEFPVDASNRGAIYTKVIEDLLVKAGKLKDDSAEYVNDTGRIKYIRSETKKMIVRISKSDNSYS